MKTTLILAPALLFGLATAAQAAPHHRGDANGDGTLTRAELTDKLDQRFARLDADGDGRITTAEMDAAKAKRAERRAAMAAKNPERAARMESRMAKRQARGAERPNPDTNGDGVVTRDEFGARALARFAAMDANGDGTVTQAERQAARQARRAARG